MRVGIACQLWLVANVMVAVSCDHDGPQSTCVPGVQVSCACLDGIDGIQRCTAEGTFEACQCDGPSSELTGSDAVTAAIGGGGTGGRRALPVSGAGAGGGRAGGPNGLGGSGHQAGKTASPGGSSGASGDHTAGETSRSAGQGAAGVDGSAADGGSTEPLPDGVLSEGADTLVGAFVADAGIVIVLSTGVRVVRRDGSELKRWDAPRPLMAAALDGTLLGVADGAKVTALDLAADLNALSSTELIEACTAAVMVSNHRFVCGPSNDWDRVYYIYDLLQGKLLASSNKYTYNGRPMRRVPGRDAFITVSDDLSPSDFHLYTVAADSTLTYLGESPYHGDFSISNIYAFDGEPPNHLVTSTGLLLDIGKPECTQPSTSSTALMGCFVKDGALGTLTGAQTFVGMSTQGGLLYALLDVGSTSGPSSPTRNYLLQSIDVAAREVKTQSVHALDVVRVVAIAFDAQSSKVMVAHDMQAAGTSAMGTTLPYRVELLSLE